MAINLSRGVKAVATFGYSEQANAARKQIEKNPQAAKGIAAIAAVAGPALTVVAPPVGLAVMAVGAVVGTVAAKAEAKKALDAARAAANEAQSQYEKQQAQAAEVYQNELDRALQSSQLVEENLKVVQQQLNEARSAGDQLAVDSLNRQMSALRERLVQEKEIAQKAYDTGLSQLKALEEKGAALYGQDLSQSSKLREQFQQQNAAALGREVENRAYEDRVQKQVTEQALQEAGLESGTPRGLVAARSEQDARFAAMKEEAARGAAARGEDPRRAMLAVEMEQARAAGSLSAGYRKNRIQELQQIAQGNRLSSGGQAASIAAQGLQLGTPTEGREMAQFLETQGMRQFQLGQNLAQTQLGISQNVGAEGSRLYSAAEAQRQANLQNYYAGLSNATIGAANAKLGIIKGIGTAEQQLFANQTGAGNRIAGMYEDASKASSAAAAEAVKANQQMIQDMAKNATTIWSANKKTA